MDICDLLNCKLKEQSMMLEALDKELSAARECIRKKDKVFEDFRVEAAKNLAKKMHEQHEIIAKSKADSAHEADKLKSNLRDLELQLFKERLKSKQLEDKHRALMEHFSQKRSSEVAVIVAEMNQMKSAITKTLLEQLKH
ncbi:hypothetical protein HDU83_000470 [Entophlyctis luteolus]|nr:hypothetical protein HDU83_000470 [Entophlyctis luteolus]